MNDIKLSGKIEQARQKISAALTEYALNWDTLASTQDKSDLIGFLKIWKEEFNGMKEPTPENQYYHLANLLSNLEIQQDMLRTRKDWKQDGSAPLPDELAAIETTIGAPAAKN